VVDGELIFMSARLRSFVVCRVACDDCLSSRSLVQQVESASRIASSGRSFCWDIRFGTPSSMIAVFSLRLLGSDGEERTVSTDHVIAGTGYRVDLRRLTFLSTAIRSQLRASAFVPILSAEFESSIPGLYFIGLASAQTFGPSMRFVVGARFTARRLARHFSRTSSHR
jgi:hypothetical protein